VQIVGALDRVAKANESANEQEETDSRKKTLREWAAIVLAAVALVATIGQYVIFRRQLQVGSAAAVSLTSISVRTYGSKGPDGQLLWYFTPRVENSGNTPTQGLILVWGVVPEWAFGANTIKDNGNSAWDAQTDKTAGVQTTAIGPHVQIAGLTFGSNAAFLNGVLQNKTALYYTMSARYRDIFNAPHITEFCARISVPNRDYSVVSEEVFQADAMQCPTHNCMDDECAVR
jgi:hypothetical protein